MRDDKRLIEVPIAYLWEGLVLEDDVYDPDGKVLLIPKGEKITARKLEQLSHFGTKDNCIATYRDSYQVILEGKEAPEEVRQKMIERETGYTGLKKDVKRVLKISQSAEQLERSEVEKVTLDVVEKLQNIELFEIVKCIHVPRPIDEKLERHLLNVGFLNGMIGEWLQLSDEEVKKLVLVGVLHDIGKTKIPEEILNVPRKFTDEEYEVVKMHPLYSSQLLSDQFDESIKTAILHHHERGDGSGYPDGLKGENIPLFSRITAISDVYDAMVSKRCYKEAVIPFEILERIENAEFEGFDPILVAIFVKNMISYYKHKQVKMSDGTQGEVIYIPPNDINHPVIRVEELVKQVDEAWYPVQIM